MHHPVFSKAPSFVTRLPCTQHAPPARTGTLFHCVYTLASSRLSTSNGCPLTHARFFSSGRMISSHRDGATTGSDPFHYTSGRWLHRDTLEREARTVRFDFDALRSRVVALCPGANSIISYSKKEGGFNRVFIFHTDNAKRVVARLPFSVAGPQSLTTNSEVATIKFIQAKTSIPIPKILEWSDDPSNTIGSEYIIMEHAPGVSLHEKWQSMDVSDQIKCIRAIFEKLRELVDLDFQAYGSLYFADTPYIAAQKLPFDQEFAIGPHCGAIYWDCNVGQPRYFHDVHPNRGPWPNLAAYCNGLIDNGIARLPPADLSPRRPRYHGSVQTHRRLLEQGHSVLSKMAMDSRIQKAAVPVIFHPDLHARNIFVSAEDPTTISAIIDWQSSGIQPAFWHADEIPDFAQPIPDHQNEDRTEPKSEACAKVFNACIQFLAPKLATARLIDESLLRPFRYSYRTWADGAVAFHEELIQTALHWDELGFTEPCPFTLPSPDELARHQQDYKLFEAKQQLKHLLPRLLNTESDGWIPPEQWEATQSAHREAFAGILQEVLATQQPDDDEPIRNEDDLRDIWPFDLPV
ncbi:hypothetical protein EJ05DRAFT_491012 [Pseudovirgaria hyperparasitica]|uniref:Altered inheritance of mitochondria protein 9, mitochondrial n=1 Tax=Pseudovirgaria hyperparasitica TaxID=470096 RepID=A0A6A6WK96_9PEZI|nr:uncharacterized protein EJ05DRAFT_491012 [Pseudovirgaria hyperparasitica]KAF2762597.1 hypothetical protein EJ05DRAFT_491012 [Pseudovirgaria hyperparasitica]